MKQCMKTSMNGRKLGLALEKSFAQKRRVAKAYNKHAKSKCFDISNLIWKTILLTSTDNEKFGKLSSTWEGPYLIGNAFTGNAYRLMEIDGKELPRSINGKFLKKFYPSMWEARGIEEE